jgi:hypothetical protein
LIDGRAAEREAVLNCLGIRVEQDADRRGLPFVNREICGVPKFARSGLVEEQNDVVAGCSALYGGKCSQDQPARAEVGRGRRVAGQRMEPVWKSVRALA